MILEVLISVGLHLLLVTIVYGILVEQVLLALVVRYLSDKVDVIVRSLELYCAYGTKASLQLIAFVQSLFLISVNQRLTDNLLRTYSIDVVEQFTAYTILHRGECARNIIAVIVELVVLERWL